MPAPPIASLSSPNNQQGRNARLSTPLGPGVLNAVSFDGVEGLSELFEFTIDAVAGKIPLIFDPAIGQNCTISIDGKTDVPREFSGILTGVRWLGIYNDSYLYRLTLRPWLWLLSKTADCRIFAKIDVPTIIRTIFTDRGFIDFNFKLSETYKPREYTVQYRETDLNFVLRLMEEEGIFYFFEHTGNKHVLVCGDSRSAHSTLVSASTVMYQERLLSGRSDMETIYALTSSREFQPGKVTLNDYDYMKPSANLVREYANSPSHSLGSLELYDYPGRYTEQGLGEHFARVILEAEQAIDHRRHATGDVVHMLPGRLTQLMRHPEPTENQEYLIIKCTHSFAAQEYRSTATLQLDEPYNGTYELQPANIPFRALSKTQRPRIVGPQTAKVVTEVAGEEVDIDKEGRILVQFYWDRRKDNSRRVRIAQTWAGKGWGSIVIPRVGQEVVVEYLEGDPDQPLITGCIYNAEMTVPYELAANKTKTGIKSNSSKGGNGYNELSFDDKKGEEVVEMHAQKDLKLTVLNSSSTQIGQDFQPATGSPSRKTGVKHGDDELKLDSGSQTIDVKIDQNVKAGRKITLEAGLQIEFIVGKTKMTMTQTGIKIESAGVLDIKAPGKTSVDGGAMMDLKAGIIKIN